MNLDVSYMWPGAVIGWLLVAILLTARRWKKLLLTVIAWVVCLDVFAILNSIVTPLFQHSPRSQAIEFAFLLLPYAVLLWLVVRTILRPHNTTPNDHD